MLHTNHTVMTHRGLLLFKWLMVLIPPVAITLGHIVLGHVVGRLAEILVVASLTLVLAYIFVFRILRKLEAEALAREQDILTMNAVMRERERLGRELHDGAAQLVAHLLLRVDTIRELIEADRKQEAETELERLHGVADEIYEDIGESLTGIRTNVPERGLIRTLQDYVDQFEERHRIPVNLRTDEVADELSPLAAFQIFRLIQEALTNVRKHAGARAATVRLTADGSDQLRIVIADDGQGFATDSQRNGKAPPLGLTSMRERVESLGGTFHVKSQPGSGTHVTAAIPIPRTKREDWHAARATPPG
ncbi:MAG: sensor histidine kinase [Chloroflexota bacterium]|nr:sensor histidine kinase [Chloroflexota bacterium]